MTAEQRAEKLFATLVSRMQDCDREIADASPDNAQDLREEMAAYLMMSYPLAIVLDQHLPSDVRVGQNQWYTLLLGMLND